MQETRHHTPRVVIIGAGAVGGAYAAALLGTGLAAEIVLLDRDTARADSVARDLIAAASFAPPARVWVGGVADCAGAALTVLTAGVAPGSPARPVDLARETSALVRQMAPQVARHNPRGLLLIATDPVDVLTYAAVTLSGLPARQVIGSGTIVETARFRAVLGAHCDVDPQDVQAFIVGAHGVSVVPVWSSATIAGVPLARYCAAQGVPYDETVQADLAGHGQAPARADQPEQSIHAVVAGLIRITMAILRAQCTVLTVSSLIEDDGHNDGSAGLCLSVPTVVDQSGVARVLRRVLSPQERERLRHAAGVLRVGIAEMALEERGTLR